MTVLATGATIAGRYVIERELAQGGFGAVYVAQHNVTEERVALKVLWPHVLKSKEAVERFQLEAAVAARVGSEHIVRVLDAGFDETLKMPFLVMELLKGKTLEHMVVQDGPLAPIEALGVLSQTASALEKAHNYKDAQGNARPIIHRDLKPENLFFARRENGEPCVKVLDFGIAKVLSETSKVSREVKGTPLFMSAEQMLGGKIGPGTDIWALGLIAFFLLSGKSYWVAAANPDADMHALFAEVLHLPMESATARAGRLGATVSWPSSFDAWLTRCLQREPGDRFSSVGAAIESLSLALGTPDSRPDSPLLVRARTILADRSHLAESLALAKTQASSDELPAVRIGSQPAVGRSDDQPVAARSAATPVGVSQGELPAVSQTRGASEPTLPAGPNVMPLVYGAFALAGFAIIGLVVALVRPWQTVTNDAARTLSAAVPPTTSVPATAPPPSMTASVTPAATFAPAASSSAAPAKTTPAGTIVKPPVKSASPAVAKQPEGDPFHER